MIRFTAVIQKFEKQGEKTGWTYIAIPAQRAETLNPGVRTSYRVKGLLGSLAIEKLALLPMGDGGFILPLNADLRKRLKKPKGAEVAMAPEPDERPLSVDADFLACLRDDPQAARHFASLTKGHQNYFSKWIESAKTETTKAKRIALALSALAKGWGYPDMIRAARGVKG